MPKNLPKKSSDESLRRKIKELEGRIKELEEPKLIKTTFTPVRSRNVEGRSNRTRVYHTEQWLDPILYKGQIRTDTYRRLDESLFTKETMLEARLCPRDAAIRALDERFAETGTYE